MPQPDANVRSRLARVPESMRAWRVTALGEPADALSLETVPVPAPAAG